MDGHRNMMALARPYKPGKGKDAAPGLWWHGTTYWNADPARYKRLYAYCRQDVEVERELFKRIGLIPPEEQAVWLLDATINDRGIYIDGELAAAAIKIDGAEHAAINAELASITGGAVSSVNQDEKLRAWLAANDCPIDNIQKGTIGHALARKNIGADARRVLALRRDGAHAATAKYAAMLNWRNPDGPARGCLNYHGASSGRWSSLGIQLQNLKRVPPGGVMTGAIDAVKTGDLAHLCKLCPDNPLSLVGDIARGALCAAPGYRFIDADFSGIGSRITAWLAGESTKVDQWKKFDETGSAEDEPYYKVGVIFRLPPEDIRAKGKVGDLAFGFAGGVGAYRALAKDDPSTDEEIDRYKKAWRRAHPKTCQFWCDIEATAIDAMQHPGERFKVGKHVSWCHDGGDFLRMRLPSGRELAYPFPRLFVDDRECLKLVHKDNYLGKWVDVTHFGKLGTWNGKPTENAVQAVARDIFAAAMPRLEAAGYPVVLHLHDEIMSEVPVDFGSKDEFIKIITAMPAWAGGLPIVAKGDVRSRFCKIKPADPIAREDRPPAVDAPAEPREPHAPEPEETAESDDTVDVPFDTDEDAKAYGNTREDFTSTADYTQRYDRDGYPNGNGEDHTGGSFGPSYVYRGANGEPFMRTTRKINAAGQKEFPQQHWDGGKWIWGKPRGPKIIACRN